MGAGILPVCIHKNKIYFLFGKENKYADTPGWSDFGGGIEKGEDELSSALREAEEESCGFLNIQDLKQSIKRNGLLEFNIKGYTTFLVKVPYDSTMVTHFNNSHAFIETKIPEKILKTSYIFEKEKMKWVSWEDMRHLDYRSFYQKIVTILVKEKKQIQQFIKKQKTRQRRHPLHKTRRL